MALLRDAYWKDSATEERGWCVERDRIAFALQYCLSLRIGEIVSLNVESFHEASWAPPELGPFAVADVIGKGSACQGPKQRTVMVTDIQVRTLLEWYLEHVRPRFCPLADESALFLTRAGTRLGRSYYIHWFKRYLRMAGLEKHDYSTHALRRAGLTHTAQRTGIFFAQQQGGHVYLSTTQDYVEIADEEIQALHHQAASQTIARIANRMTLTTASSQDFPEA
jgi:site-specific recombinase XerD